MIQNGRFLSGQSGRGPHGDLPDPGRNWHARMERWKSKEPQSVWTYTIFFSPDIQKTASTGLKSPF